jgi:type IV pilus assembly protein PilO
MNAQDFQNLDPNNLGNWPIPVKGVIIIIVCAAALGAGYWFITQPQLDTLLQAQRKEEELRKDFKDKQWKAATFPKLKAQLDEIESTIKEQKNRLPSGAEVAELITEISQQMIANGLEQELFRPDYQKQKEEKGVYEKLPIKIRVKGDFHSFGKFISGVSAMPRIVTQHEVSIQASTTPGDNKLTMEMTAQIYRYLEEKAKTEDDKNKAKDDKDKPKPEKK